MGLYTKYVEIGRVALINYGPEKGKIVTIVDVLDQNRVLIDGASNGIKRQVMKVAYLSLTSIKTKIPRAAGAKLLSRSLERDQVVSQWEKTAAARKIASAKKTAALTDFDRFKIQMAKKTRASALKKSVSSLALAYNKAANTEKKSNPIRRRQLRSM